MKNNLNKKYKKIILKYFQIKNILKSNGSQALPNQVLY